ncbi:hypothetical protein P153DRAFT_435545 [Dothidotthia symphoricarpi CBS 119687]|uniref:C3H1-type domain-containing protein n=1 Tax=Dothidotthia symphoricarpi CBS 119687 TaxID=1392245 RepID=A0A6A5ZYE0_9PLEO|nr:uncharacterized protein P153DRAFT_435545 [Dothidotthia symphoricarpi CBS 119687]KAF2123914.1 hypothetical protein P153DRAFT_435545 [Dothidotthia symphoricarpi CBS 119687]
MSHQTLHTIVVVEPPTSTSTTPISTTSARSPRLPLTENVMSTSNAKRKRSADEDQESAFIQFASSQKINVTASKVRREERRPMTRDIKKWEPKSSVERIVDECFEAHCGWLKKHQKPELDRTAMDQYRAQVTEIMSKVETPKHISHLGDILIALATQREQIAIQAALATTLPNDIRNALDALHLKQNSPITDQSPGPINTSSFDFNLRNVVAKTQYCSDFLHPLGLSLNSPSTDEIYCIPHAAAMVVKKKLAEVSEEKLREYQKGLAARREDHEKELRAQEDGYKTMISDEVEKHKRELISLRDGYEKKFAELREAHREELRGVKAGHKDDVDRHIQARRNADEREKAHCQRAETAEQQARKTREEKEDLERQFLIFKTEAEHHQAKQAKDEETQRKLHEKATARQALQRTGKTNKLALQDLTNLVTTGTVTPAKLEALNMPDKTACLTGLKDLWRSSNTLIRTITPHDLLTDSDMLLAFDVNVIAQARCFMYMLQCWGYTAAELLATEWELRAMVRLQSGLVPHEDLEPLAGLKRDVDFICLTLREAAELVQAPNPLHMSFASSTSTQQPSVFDLSFGSSTGSTSMTATSTAPFILPPTTGPFGVTPTPFTLPSPTPTTPNQPPIDTNPPDPMTGIEHPETHTITLPAHPQKPQECLNFLLHKCHKTAAACQYRHPICAHFRKGSCRFGDTCRRSHDPSALNNTSSIFPAPAAAAAFAQTPALSAAAKKLVRNALNPSGQSPSNLSNVNYFQTPSPAPVKNSVCTPFLHNKCPRGNSCTYQHPTSRIPCPRYASGACSLGAACEMVHDPRARRAGSAANTKAVRGQLACRFEGTGVGCRKVGCSFLHTSRKLKAVGEPGEEGFFADSGIAKPAEGAEVFFADNPAPYYTPPVFEKSSVNPLQSILDRDRGRRAGRANGQIDGGAAGREGEGVRRCCRGLWDGDGLVLWRFARFASTSSLCLSVCLSAY